MKDIRKRLQASLRLLKVLMVATIIGAAAAASYAEKVEDLPQPTDYVSDFAHVLSPDAVARIDRICTQLDNQAHAQIAVVTVRNLDGDDAADFATRLFEKYKIGAKGTDRGVLILLAVDDHKYFINTGYGVEGILPDGKTGDIGRTMVSYLRAGDYDGAVLTSVTGVAQVIADDAKVTLDQNDLAQAPAPVEHDSINVVKLIFFIIFFILFVAFRLLRFFGGWFTGGWWGSGPWMGGGYGGGMGGGRGGFGGGGGFGGFGGGGTGGGGAGGSW